MTRAAPRQVTVLIARSWQVVGATFLIQFVVSGSAFYADGVLLTSLAESLDADRFRISLGLTLQILVGGLLAPVAGQLISRHSIRRIMLVGAVLFSLGLLLQSQVSTLAQFYGVKTIIAVGITLAGPLPCSVLIIEWFDENRGAAMGLSQLGATLGGTASIPVLTWSIATYGWQQSLLWLGVLSSLLLPAIIMLFITDPGRPEGHSDSAVAGPTFRQLAREGRLWVLVGVFGLCFAGAIAVIQVLHSHVTDSGFGLATAALVMALLTGAAALAKPLFGTLADWLSPQRTMLLGIGLQALGLVVISSAAGDTVLLIGAVLFGLGYGSLAPLMSLLVGEAFGPATFARALGLMGVLLLPANFIGFPLATLIHGQAGNYQPAFVTFIVLYLGAGVLLALSRAHDRTRAEALNPPPTP